MLCATPGPTRAMANGEWRVECTTEVRRARESERALMMMMMMMNLYTPGSRPLLSP